MKHIETGSAVNWSYKINGIWVSALRTSDVTYQIYMSPLAVVIAHTLPNLWVHPSVGTGRLETATLCPRSASTLDASASKNKEM